PTAWTHRFARQRVPDGPVGGEHDREAQANARISVSAGALPRARTERTGRAAPGRARKVRVGEPGGRTQTMRQKETAGGPAAAPPTVQSVAHSGKHLEVWATATGCLGECWRRGAASGEKRAVTGGQGGTLLASPFVQRKIALGFYRLDVDKDGVLRQDDF